MNKNTKVCSLHFTAEDYINGNAFYSARRVLKPTAVPSVFPWTKDQYHRTTAVSQLAASPYQRFDRFDDKVEQQSDKQEPADDSSDDQFMEVDSECDDVAKLQTEVEELRAQLTIDEATLGKSLFRLENIRYDNDLIKLYTGFSDYDTPIAFYEEILEGDAKVMRQWQGKNSKNHYDEIKSGRLRKLSLIDQFFLTLVRLHLGLLELDLANRFNISKSSVSRITCTWINLMHHSLKAIERYPPWHIVKKYMPKVFEDYPNTRLIIDTTEFSIERPSSLLSLSCTFSS